jgi:hypothetical protein
MYCKVVESRRYVRMIPIEKGVRYAELCVRVSR